MGKGQSFGYKYLSIGTWTIEGGHDFLVLEALTQDFPSLGDKGRNDDEKLRIVTCLAVNCLLCL